jgi:hypothetical protein
MSKKFQIRESKRLPFSAPVEIRWVDSGSFCHSVRGLSYDASIYGLGISVPHQVPADRELTVFVKGVEVCGGGVLKHARPCESGFRIGLYFRLTLLMQNIPGLDDVLDQPPATEPGAGAWLIPSLITRFGMRIWRAVIKKTGGSLSPSPGLERQHAEVKHTSA